MAINSRRVRFWRKFILLFAVGFSWGYVAKTVTYNYLYIGHDDPQVVRESSSYPIKPLINKKRLSDEELSPKLEKFQENDISERASGQPIGI